MGYLVTLKNIDGAKMIHSPVNPLIKLTTGYVNQSAKNIDSFDFSFNQSNPADAFIKELKTEVEVIDTATGNLEFDGRIKNRTGTTQINGQTIKSYSADDAIIYLEDSQQFKFSYSGPPKGLLEKLLEHHNNHVEPHKQFAIGLCEIDAYKVYVTDDDPTVNVPLVKGGKATIKPTTKYIWNNDGIRLNIASSVLGVTHTVEAVGTNGVFADKYLLRHPNSAWGISGWIQKDDIIESLTTTKTESKTGTDYEESSIYVPGTKVRIKKSTKIYYRASDGTGAKPIRPDYLDLTYSIGSYSALHDRYHLMYMGSGRAWVNARDLEGGSTPPPTESIDVVGSYVMKNRTIEAVIDYNQSTLDAVKENLLTPFNAEIYWEYIEGVRTLNIVYRRVNETDQRISIGLNLITMQENFDPSSVVTRIVPLGRLKKEEVTNE